MRKISSICFSVLLLTLGILAPVGAAAQAQETPQPAQQTQTPAQESPAVGKSNIANNVCKGVLSAERGTFSPDTTIESCLETGDSSFGFLVRRIVNIFSIVVGAVSVIMIIVGGFRYIISGGDSSGVQGAKNTILYAIVGLVIVLFAQVIVRFILQNATQSLVG